MSNRRINISNNLFSDPYGSYSPTNGGTIVVPSTSLMSKSGVKDIIASTANFNNVSGSNDSSSITNQLNNLRTISVDRPDAKFDGASTALGIGAGVSKTLANTDLSSKEGRATAGVGLGVSVAAPIASSFGDLQIEKGNIQKGSTMKGVGQGASTGASIGGAIGSVVPVIGTAIGTAAGAVVGSIIGGISGNKKGKQEQNNVNNANAEIRKFNTGVLATRKKLTSQQADINNSNKLISMNGNGGLLVRYQTGGQLTEEQQQQAIQAIIEMAQQGADVKSISKKLGLPEEAISQVLTAYQEQQQTNTTPSFKKGGKIKMKPAGKLVKKCDCGCSKTKMFRRGGVLDVEKENVIIDGPSHDDFNKTGVKGDKGLPVVKNGVKVAEIESGELVLNKKSSEKLQALKDKAKSGDKEAIEQLGLIMANELAKNTYDYR